MADDWLRKVGRELTTAGCTDAERVRLAAHQLDGPAASWWENFTATFPVDTVTWDQFQQAFRTAHVSARSVSFATCAKEDEQLASMWRNLVS